MAQNITWDDKQTAQASPLPSNQKLTADDANEIKNVVNQNATELDNKIGDAPQDGNGYVRKDGAWEQEQGGGGGVPEAPNDGSLYGRQSEDWQEIDLSTKVDEAPQDGNKYGRKDVAWEAINEGIPEAPNDGSLYGRKDEDWEVIDIDSKVDEAPQDGNSYVRKDATWEQLQTSSGIKITAFASDLTDTDDTDPTSGVFKFNDADLTLATFIYVSKINANGLDVGGVILGIEPNSKIALQQDDNIAKQMIYSVTGEPIDATTYVKVPVLFESNGSGGVIDDASLIIFALIPAEANITSSNERQDIVFNSDLDNVHKTGFYMTPIQIVDVPFNGITSVTYQGALNDGNLDFAGGSGESVSLITLNSWLDGLADNTQVVIWTITQLTRPSGIKRTINLS